MAKNITEDTNHIEKLVDAENYKIWRFQLNIVLEAHELQETIKLETPVEQRNDAWKKKDANSQKLIIMSIDKKPLLHIMSCKTAYQMWTKLE